uniref:Integrin beta n=1 Tax=Salmo trutta TaxID=8032 RepID=A0A674ETE0_SALTR
MLNANTDISAMLLCPIVNHCLATRASTCSECIQSGKGCAYCPDEVRRNYYSSCPQTPLTRHKYLNEQINMLLKQSQVAPQEMSMTLLPGEEREIEMEVFEPAKGPLDLYILMDFSNSMEDDLDNLKRMGAELAALVGKLSDDYTIGFGKFVDKVVEPQTDMRPSKLAKPWPNSDPPFSFRHVITLTSDLRSFTEKLQKERISGNLDAPEGGFDAILQAAVCGEKIGWRSHATHLLVFSTESAFHYEADGANVLAGIMPRNDEQCHLDPNGKYTEDTRQDYPSVPTLVRLLGKHNIIPIFAITNHSFTYYQKLYEYFPIAELGLLQEDSANILNILEKAFEVRMGLFYRFIYCVYINHLHTHTHTHTHTNPFCVFQGKFKVRVKASEMVGEQHVCSLEQGDKKGKMRVKPTTFSTALNINAEVQTDTYELGPFCNCSTSASPVAGSSCLGPDVGEPCSGRGDCLCGTCVCYNTDQYEGPLCQFDKSQCQRYGGFLCNDRGRCFMGQCACAEGWEGPACECPMSNQTCLDTKGGVCNGRGVCKCGRCECQDSGLAMTPTCEANFQAQLGMCEDKRSCVQCQAWKTGEKKDSSQCDQCKFKVVMVDELKENKEVIEACSFRDEDDDCTYHYTVDYPEDQADKELEVQVLKKKDCPPAGFLWLIPLIMFLMLLLGLLLLCCWKYCACCKACLALLPCCGRGRMVGFKEDQYMLRQSLLTSDHLDTPLVRTGPPKSTDVVRWKITDNVHRLPNHPLAKVQPNPKETSECEVFPNSISPIGWSYHYNFLLNEVYKNVPGAQRVQKTKFRLQRNAGKRKDHTIVDTVVSAPRSSYPDIVKLTEKNVQSGNFQDLKVVPGYYTVATDKEAAGAVEFQEGVEMVDVRVPLFIKEDDDDKKQLQVEALDVPLGIAEIGKRFVNITIIKEHAKSIMTFLQPSYTYSRQDGVANIPISREIIEDGHTQVTYRTRDLTAKDKKDYVTVDGELSYGPGETQKTVPVRLLELGEGDGLLKDTQVKQFVMDLTNPRQGAKLGRYPRTTGKEFINQTGMSPGGRLFSPTNVKAKATGPRNIRLNWDPLGNPLGYKVKYWIYGDPETDEQVIDVKTTHAELTNLYPFCDYEMKVCGYNALGNGNYSDMVPCRTLEDVPSEPGRLAFNVISPTVTQVSWAEPAETNGVITNYEVLYTPINDDTKPMGVAKKVKIDNPKKRMLLIENLQSAQTYCYKVRAKNSVGWGPFREATINLASQPVRPMSIPIIPDIPIVDAEAGDEYDGYLMYSSEVLRSPTGSKRPSVSDEGFIKLVGSKLDLRSVSWKRHVDVIPYHLSTDTDTSTDETPRASRAQTPSLKGEDHLPGVLDSQTRQIDRQKDSMPATAHGSHQPPMQLQCPLIISSLATQNMHDRGSFKMSLNSRLAPGVPDTPTRLVFSALGPTALKVSWQEPHCDRDVLGYCVLYQLLNGGDMKRIDVSSPADNSVVVQDLLPNHSYLFKVKAQSLEGWGPEREGVITIESAVNPNSPLSPMPGSPFTLSTPSAPGPLVFTALSPEALQLSWEKPRKPNGDILGYVVTCEQLHGGGETDGNSAETSLTVPDLCENMPYKFKVQARTTQGFGPEREGIITIESQDGGKRTDQSLTKRGVFQLPTEVSTHSNVTHTMINDPYFSGDGMMMTSQHTETSGMVTRHVTKEVVQRSMQVAGSSSVTKKVERSFYEA